MATPDPDPAPVSATCATPAWIESDRLAALDGYHILDTERETAFDNLVELAAFILDAPIAVVNFISSDRQWFKSEIGIGQDELPLDVSICRFAILQPGLFLVEDLSVDPRFASNPLVTAAGGLRFYAGVLLETPDGLPLGTICVLDSKPRPDGITDAQSSALKALAGQAMGQLELRRLLAASGKVVEYQQALSSIGDQIRESMDVPDMVQRTAQVVSAVLQVDRAGFGSVDSRTETVDIQSDWTRDGLASIVGRYRFADFGRITDELAQGEPLVIADVAADFRTSGHATALHRLDIGALVNMPVRDRGETVAVLIVHSKDRRRWEEPELAFLRSVADRLETGMARFRADQLQGILNAEISHRLKNMLSMVQAIASQTLRHIPQREPIDNFERRLVALSSAHDVLLHNDWKSAELSDILRAALDSFGYSEKVELRGPAVSLGARASMSLALIVHELTTNAVKYGALSTDAGRVLIDWDIRDHDNEPTLRLNWRETGGPQVVNPERRGFGSKLIKMGLVGMGGVSLRYEKSGVEAEMYASVSHLALS